MKGSANHSEFINVAPKGEGKSGWKLVKFGEVATLINGRAYKRAELLNEGTPVLRIQNLNGGNRWYYSDLQLPDDKYCEEDDLLFAWSASFGPYIWKGPKAIYHYHIWKVLPSPELDKRFAFHLLDFLTQSVKDAAHGVAMLHITKGKMEAWEMLLPPLTEQKRIANILDAADALRAKRREAIADLEKLLQSTFLEMFGDPVSNPMGWEVKTLDEVGNVQTGSTPPSKHDGMFDGSIPFVTPGDLRDSWVKSVRTVTEAGADNSRTVSRGATLVCCIGATIGKMGKATEFSAFNQQINAITWGDEIEDEVGLELMRFFKTKIAKDGASTTLPILKKSLFQKIAIPIPRLDIQRRFIAIVESIEGQKARQKEHLTELEVLFASLQTRAFNGDL